MLFGIGLAGAAPAASASASHTVARSCNLNNDHWSAKWGQHIIDLIDYAWGEWTANPCGQRLQVKIFCRNQIVGSTYWAYSGKVKGVNVKAEADCSLDDELLVADMRLTNANGTWRPYFDLCGPCGLRKEST